MKTKNCDNGSKIWRREIVDGADYLKKSIQKRIISLTYYTTYRSKIK